MHFSRLARNSGCSRPRQNDWSPAVLARPAWISIHPGRRGTYFRDPARDMA